MAPLERPAPRRGGAQRVSVGWAAAPLRLARRNKARRVRAVLRPRRRQPAGAGARRENAVFGGPEAGRTGAAAGGCAGRADAAAAADDGGRVAVRRPRGRGRGRVRARRVARRAARGGRRRVHSGHHVRVAVAGRSTVLKVAAALFLGVVAHAARRAAVGHAPLELFDGRRLVPAREPLLVARAVRLNVLLVLPAQLLQRRHNVLLVAAFLPHGLGGEVGVAARAVPVALDWLGFVIDVQTLYLGHALQQVASHPQVVALLNAHGRADLELPLARRHLGVDARDLEPGVHARLEVRVDHIPAKHLGARHAAVVGPLRLGLTVLGEAQRLLGGGVDEEVLLLQPEPRLELLGVVHGQRAGVARVGGQRRALGGVGVAHDEDVGAAAERIREDGLRLEDDLRVGARRLSRGAAVVVPLGQIGRARRRGLEVAGLAAELVEAVDPDVLGDAAGDVQVAERVDDRHVVAAESSDCGGGEVVVVESGRMDAQTKGGAARYIRRRGNGHGDGVSAPNGGARHGAAAPRAMIGAALAATTRRARVRQ
ncbi:hypothetical protein FGB62_1g6102 [Gracilaria domingensis]|nr:hypothetical protein FGB62_1g6102 [Gracilaria domingensis]